MSKKSADDAAKADDENLSVVRVDRDFEYRGANFEQGKYYRIKDEPQGFIDNKIYKRQNGAVVDEKDLPEGAEVLDDPRPAAAAAQLEKERREQNYIRQEERARPQRDVPGMATTFTGTENVFGGTHTPEGSGPGMPLGTDPRKANEPASGDSTPAAGGSDTTAGSGGTDDGTAAGRSRRPASIRT